MPAHARVAAAVLLRVLPLHLLALLFPTSAAHHVLLFSGQQLN
jgi:hypothetical protein